MAQPILSQTDSVKGTSLISNIDKLVNKWRQNDVCSEQQNQKDKADKLLNLGMLYIENEKYFESIDCLEQAADIFISLNDNDYYAYTLTLLYRPYHILGNTEKYSKIIELLDKIFHSNAINNKEIRLIVSSKIAEYYEDKGEYRKALNLYANNLTEAEGIYRGEMQLFPYYYKMASLYLKLGIFNEVKKNIEKAKMLSAKNSSTFIHSREYYSLLLLECSLLQDEGEVGIAISKLEKICGNIEAEDELWETKATAFSTLGILYNSIGNPHQALSYDEKALKACAKYSGSQSTKYVIQLLNISETYSLIGDYQKGLYLTTEACNIVEHIYGKNHPLYYECLSKLASRYRNIDNDKSKLLYHECLQLCVNLFGEESEEYAECLVCSTDIFSNPYNNGINVLNKAIDIKRKLGHTNNSIYYGYVSWLSILLKQQGKWDELYDISSELLESIRQNVISIFRNLSENQRETFWKDVKQSIKHIESMAASYSIYAAENKDFALVDKFGSLAYNARLLKKGLLLTSSQQLRVLIENSKDPRIATIKSNLDELKQVVESVNPADNISHYNQLQREINNNERELMDIVLQNNRFMNFATIRWNDIQHALHSGEVAIEFFSYPAQDKTQYGAVWVSDKGFPLIRTLFSEDELRKFKIGGNSTYDYSSPQLYKTIWSVLESFSDIRNATTIYFSADNILNTIAIENLRDTYGILASEKRRLYRLSSTRELVARNIPMIENKYAALYGGLNYDATVEDLLTANKSDSISTDSLFSRYTGNRAFRNKAEYLPWSLSEVQSISNLLKTYKIKMFSGNTGTEESIMKLENDRPNLLHISTHGFYYAPEDIKDSTISLTVNQILRLNDTCTPPSTETLAMRGTGLLFSGANLILSRASIPDNLADGLLTAEELSKINLKGVDLAVLSACSTGLGVSSEEGIFGLQRGFKLAGVNSLLMSLWEVDDKATSLLMQYFYQNLLQGHTKEQSLKFAQNNIRHSKRYSNPSYWAGWILLDGLN